MTVSPQHGVFVTLDDARRLVGMLESASRVASASAATTDLTRRLRAAVESVAKLAATQSNPQGFVRLDPDPGQHAAYDLLTASETAMVLQCTTANVRDLRRRGALPAHQAGRQWLYPARSVYARAERKADRRAG